MCVRVSFLGDARPCARGVERFTFVPGYAAAWKIRKRSVSRPLFSALASAASTMLRIFWAAFIGYRPDAACVGSPCLCPDFLLYLVNGTGFFFCVTSRRYAFAFVRVMPFMVLQTSRACLWDTLISLPEAFAVFSGSSASGRIEYPHFGMFYFSVRAINSVEAIYMAFRMLIGLKLDRIVVSLFAGMFHVRCAVYLVAFGVFIFFQKRLLSY
jgi:hypothetical protein